MPLHPGDTLLNKYSIEKLIGTGNFADVYQAQHATNGAPSEVAERSLRPLGVPGIFETVASMHPARGDEEGTRTFFPFPEDVREKNPFSPLK